MVSFARVVETVEHVVQHKLNDNWILLTTRLHQVNAAQEPGVLAPTERPHHGLDAVRQGPWNG